MQGYRTVLQPVLRHPVASKPVPEVTVADIEALIAWLGTDGARPAKHTGAHRGGLGPRSIRATLVALGPVFRMAERDGLVGRNVVRLAERPAVRKRRGRDLEHWQPGDLLRFRDQADGHEWAGAWLTLCGMSCADVMELRWADVDLDAGVVSVSQGRVALYYGDATDDPKSAQRVRQVPVGAIHPGAVEVLRDMQQRQSAQREALGAPDSGMVVVVDALARPLRPERYSDTFRELCDAAGVRSINLHSVRHSLAFWLHSLGVTPADAAALLGHTIEVHPSGSSVRTSAWTHARSIEPEARFSWSGRCAAPRASCRRACWRLRRRR